jgi:hypothetical protein
MMMSRRLLLGATAALVISVVALVGATRTGDTPAPAASTEITGLHAELAGLRQRVDASDRSATTAMRLALATPQAGSAAPNAAVSAEPARPVYTATAAQIDARLTNRFGHEPADAAWSRPAQALLDSHIRAGLPDGSRVVSLECRQTMCRVESEHTSLAIYARFVNEALLFPTGGWNGPVMTQILSQAGPQITSVAYLLRDGEDFAPYLE